MTLKEWNKLVDRAVEIDRELETGFEMNEKELYRERLELEGRLAPLEN